MFSSSILRPLTFFVPFIKVYCVMLHRDWSYFMICLIFFSVIDSYHFLDNSQDMISFMITTGSLNSQDITRILKQSRDNSGKHLCDGYCIDIMWCLCVEVKIQQRAIWFCKASLRICDINLFECKGPSMLKTNKLIF